jgi:hypothetical protein
MNIAGAVPGRPPFENRKGWGSLGFRLARKVSELADPGLFLKQRVQPGLGDGLVDFRLGAAGGDAA